MQLGSSEKGIFVFPYVRASKHGDHDQFFVFRFKCVLLAASLHAYCSVCTVIALVILDYIHGNDRREGR